MLHLTVKTGIFPVTKNENIFSHFFIEYQAREVRQSVHGFQKETQNCSSFYMS